MEPTHRGWKKEWSSNVIESALLCIHLSVRFQWRKSLLLRYHVVAVKLSQAYFIDFRTYITWYCKAESVGIRMHAVTTDSVAIDPIQLRLKVPIRVAYNDANSVVMEAPGSASPMWRSRYFPDMQLFLGYRPVDLSGDAAYIKAVLDRISAIC